jgi:hypothetical protein
MTAALVGFLGVVVGLAVGFGYRFWSTRREELMSATIAATFLRDAARSVQHGSANPDALTDLWDEQRVALIRLITPADYELLARSVRVSSRGETGLVAVLDRLTMLFWREHQAFILTPLIKYIRRDDLSDKVSVIVHELTEQQSAAALEKSAELLSTEVGSFDDG